MAESNEGAGCGVGFFGLLGLLFIALKLTGFVDWSWWLVLLPLYGVPLLGLAGLLVFSLFCLAVVCISCKAERENRT